MKNLETQNQRLIKWAEHLNSMKNFIGQLFDTVILCELEENVNIRFEVKYFYLAVEELPNVFDEFSYSEITGEVVLEGLSDEEGPIASVIDFFGLTPEEFCQILDCEGYQFTERHGGKVLTEASGPSDIAFNIYELVKTRSKNLID